MILRGRSLAAKKAPARVGAPGAFPPAEPERNYRGEPAAGSRDDVNLG